MAEVKFCNSAPVSLLFSSSDYDIKKVSLLLSDYLGRLVQDTDLQFRQDMIEVQPDTFATSAHHGHRKRAIHRRYSARSFAGRSNGFGLVVGEVVRELAKFSQIVRWDSALSANLDRFEQLRYSHRALSPASSTFQTQYALADTL